jgi:hypothetical protein
MSVICGAMRPAISGIYAYTAMLRQSPKCLNGADAIRRLLFPHGREPAPKGPHG